MLLSIQFPLADFRRFLHTSTGCISQPNWPTPVLRAQFPHNPPFVRGFGRVRPRKAVGLEFWGEDLICDAQNAIKWQRSDLFPLTQGRRSLSFEIAFRHFVFDGATSGKCEMSLATVGRAGIQLQSPDIIGLAHWLLSHNVSVPNHGSGVRNTFHSSPLHSIPLPLQQHLLRATTRTGWMKKRTPPNWWISSGSPMLFAQFQTPFEFADLSELPITSIDVPAIGVRVSCFLVRANGLRIPFWILEAQPNFNRTRARQLRISLLRLHRDHECLRLVLDQIGTGKIAIKRNSLPTERLQGYLRETNQRLSRNRGILQNLVQAQAPDEPDIADTAFAVFERIWPGELADLQKLIEEMDLRRNIGLNLRGYTQQTIEIKELYMGDKNIFNNVSGSIINVRSTLTNVTQSIGESKTLDETTKKKMDELIKQLSDELSKLPPEKASAEDREAIADAAADVVAKTVKDNPNKKSIKISADGLLEAAKGIASVLPIALELSKTVANFLGGGF